jgi:hypothetical protein
VASRDIDVASRGITWHHVACASWKSKGIRDVPNGANWEKSKLEEVPMQNWLWESV